MYLASFLIGRRNQFISRAFFFLHVHMRRKYVPFLYTVLLLFVIRRWNFILNPFKVYQRFLSHLLVILNKLYHFIFLLPGSSIVLVHSHNEYKFHISIYDFPLLPSATTRFLFLRALKLTS